MNVLGISSFYHDSAAVILQNGEIIAAAQEERFTRKKHDPGFPSHAIRYCLQEAGLGLGDLDAIAFYDKPLLKFERLLETYYSFAPRGLKSFMTAMPVWLKEKMFLKRLIHQELAAIGPYDKRTARLLFPEHHLSHAASAFYPSPFEEAAILTIDGVGEWATATIGKGHGNQITVLKELQFPHSVGLLYTAFTYFLGFRVNSGEYKLMGLAPYGDATSERYHRFRKAIESELVTLYDDGSIWLNQDYFNYATGLEMTQTDKWESLFGVMRRTGESELTPEHCDLGLAIQHVTEEIVLRMARHAASITGSRNVCLAGGVALNCVANGRIVQEGMFDDLFIQPAAGDAGGALGAALAAHYIYEGASRDFKGVAEPTKSGEPDETAEPSKTAEPAGDRMKGSYLGPDFSEKEIRFTIRRHKAVDHTFGSDEERSNTVAGWLANGEVVGWMQGRMEFGPRALGNRSILGDPRDEEMQRKLNVKIKYRESFRPFAPSVLAEKRSEWFDLPTPSPYMLLVCPINPNIQADLPGEYPAFSLKEKLYTRRSDLPAITHIDFSARLQTVHAETNPRYHQLIAAFEKQTGVPVLVNTSFNVRGEPIVCTPEDAYLCFMRTEMDKLVIGNHYFIKTEQPEWSEKQEWMEEFPLD